MHHAACFVMHDACGKYKQRSIRCAKRGQGRGVVKPIALGGNRQWGQDDLLPNGFDPSLLARRAAYVGAVQILLHLAEILAGHLRPPHEDTINGRPGMPPLGVDDHAEVGDLIRLERCRLGDLLEIWGVILV